MGGIDLAGSMYAMSLGDGGGGSGSKPGYGGSTYKPNTRFLTGSTPRINYTSSLPK
jgi:hypothetical protein